MNQYETNFKFQKSVPFVIKDVTKPGKHERKDVTLKGYASTFGNTDRYKDVMIKGCFKKTIKETGGKWAVRLNHTDDVGINVFAREDDHGLYVESKLYTGEDALDDAEKAVTLIRNAVKYNHPMGLSIGGIVKKIAFVRDEDRPEDNHYEILEFEIVEHSITSTPANPQAEVTSIKDCFTHPTNSNMLAFLDSYIKNI